jgi:hypothetical protein
MTARGRTSCKTHHKAEGRSGPSPSKTWLRACTQTLGMRTETESRLEHDPLLSAFDIMHDTQTSCWAGSLRHE